jgi:adenine/guanine phosphoribosyltransferase-like PRPP-binding protein
MASDLLTWSRFLMPRTTYHVTITSLPPAEVPVAPYRDVYPVILPNGMHLNLPIQPLPGEEEGIALLMSNQTPFAVEQELASQLTQLAAAYAPEAIVGIPTLGLDYARLVARDLGFPDYVALGNSRKFWYEDELSVPVHSVTSPGANKKLYLDPALLSRVAGKRTLLVDDVINTGGSAVAAIDLLQRAGAIVIGLCVVLIEGDAWKAVLTPFAPDWPGRVRGLGFIPIFKKTPAGWVPLP